MKEANRVIDKIEPRFVRQLGKRLEKRRRCSLLTPASWSGRTYRPGLTRSSPRRQASVRLAPATRRRRRSINTTQGDFTATQLILQHKSDKTRSLFASGRSLSAGEKTTKVICGLRGNLACERRATASKAGRARQARIKTAA
jgi:hypothetical protein